MSSVSVAKRRIDWIDTAKGIGIILVSFGHLRNGDGQSVWLPALDQPIDYIYIFHMPLFFFLGGFTIHANKPFTEFVAKKAKTLLIPYYIFSLYFIAKPLAVLCIPQLANLLQSNHDYSNIAQQIYDVVIQGNGLWFLWAYFTGELISYVFLRYVKSRSWLFIAGIALFALYYVIVKVWPDCTLPFQIIRSLQVSGLMLLGYMCKNFFLALKSRQEIFGFVGSIILFALCLPLVDLQSIWGLLVNIVAMFFGIFACIFLAMLLQKNHYINHIGCSSISFYVVNALTLNVGKLLFFKIIGIHAQHAWAGWQWCIGIVITIFCLAILWGIDWLIRRYIPWSIGLRISKNVNQRPAEI